MFKLARKGNVKRCSKQVKYSNKNEPKRYEEAAKKNLAYTKEIDFDKFAAIKSTDSSATSDELILTEEEIEDLLSFLEKSLRDPNLERYVPESVLSGNCFPNNDPISRLERGCD